MIKLGLIGAGHLGSIHLKLIQEIADFDLVGIFDADENICNQAAEKYHCTAFSQAKALIDEVDAIDIVSPTPSHFQYAKYGLQRRKHVFVEKPLCETLEEAEMLIKLAEEAEVKTQVGHVERFNPAIQSIANLPLNPLFIEAHRLAPFNPRGTDVAVILDLMIHDIDLILSMVKANVKKVHANGVAIISKTADIANARIEFDNGCVANLTASRISLKKMRKMRVFQRDAYISLDFLDKKTEIVRLYDEPVNNGNPSFEIDTGENFEKKFISIEQPEMKTNNAIKTELELFAESILQDTPTQVDFFDACKALEVAYQILAKINKNSLVA